MQLDVVVDGLATRVQGLVPKEPAPVLLKLTVLVGADLVAASVSATVAVQVVASLTPTLAGAQVTEALVVRVPTVTVTFDPPALALPAWVLSPL